MTAALQQSGKRAALNLAQQILSPLADKVPTLVFLGPPGVGKGTYSSRIAKQLGLAHISVGDLIRLEINAGTGSGKAVRSGASQEKPTALCAISSPIPENTRGNLGRPLHA